ncbi:helix-turn-helix domain-containing protein [Streptomyces sp. NBC_01275]|uniref:helix-turn-helix domain-containing protein n=1 Tax=Streptomyces sp. NBC_01275 TaxID=2903807 RepID=UPI002B1E1E4B|nr:helix-turn-helix domain-containing protein [Streptomyces sp. NBC_01275]
MCEQKIKPLEVAKRHRVSRKSAYRWHRLWRNGRIEAATSPSRTKQASPADRPEAAPGAARTHPGRDGEWTVLGTAVGGRADRDATWLTDPAVPSADRPPRG